MKDTRISSKDLISKNRIGLSITENKILSSFWYYTSTATASLILDNETIHISNIAQMNDED